MAAYFRFQQETPAGDVKFFTFKLVDEKKISEARSKIENGDVLGNHVQGKIIRSIAPYNPEWSFHLDPNSIGFFSIQIEVCDSNVTYVEDHLDEIGGSTLPNFFWCPWSSKLFDEVTGEIDPVTEKPIGNLRGI
ncbi:hypothetical protein [Zavarzinia sp.]|uniref:BP74-related protein n=1 Tax=Zavarzinia sp. TaxID=2027920 RepID=UPI00356951B9